MEFLLCNISDVLTFCGTHPTIQLCTFSELLCISATHICTQATVDIYTFYILPVHKIMLYIFATILCTSTRTQQCLESNHRHTHPQRFCEDHLSFDNKSHVGMFVSYSQCNACRRSYFPDSGFLHP